MPTYEYECENCKKTFDVFQSITAEPLKMCPECNGEVRRLIGKGAAIIFKGSGFYATDYKKGKPEERACPADKGESCKSCPIKDKSQ